MLTGNQTASPFRFERRGKVRLRATNATRQYLKPVSRTKTIAKTRSDMGTFSTPRTSETARLFAGPAGSSSEKLNFAVWE